MLHSICGLFPPMDARLFQGTFVPSVPSREKTMHVKSFHGRGRGGGEEGGTSMELVIPFVDSSNVHCVISGLIYIYTSLPTN